MEAKDLNVYGRDALAVAVLQLAEKIEDNNRLIKTLIQRIERLEGRKEAPKGEVLLSETDEAIVKFIEKEGKATAEDVRKAFNYKGRNAASARLNKLCKEGILLKKYSGKKVYFFLAR